MLKRSKFHHGNLRQALIEAALDILDEAGPDAITIREVARRTGVSHAAPVNHFPDLRALLTEVAIELFVELSSEIANVVEGVEAIGHSRVQEFAKQLIKFGLRHTNQYRMLWRRDLVDNSNPLLISAMDGIYNSLIDEIKSLRLSHTIDPHTAAIGLWSIAHGYVSLRLDGNFQPASDEFTGEPRQDAIIDAFLASVLTTSRNS